MKAHRASSFCVAIVLLVYLYARLQHGGFREEESREAEMVRLGSKVVASDLLKRGRLWRDATAASGRAREKHNSLTNRPHWFLDSLLLLAGDIELNPGPTELDDLIAEIPTDKIDPKHLRFVVRALHDVGDRWEGMGNYMDVKDLAEIRQNYPDLVTRRLIAMVDSLLRGRFNTQPGTPASWQTIAIAVKEDTGGGNPQLARCIAKNLNEFRAFSPGPIANPVDTSPFVEESVSEGTLAKVVAILHQLLAPVASRWFEMGALFSLPLNSLTTINNDPAAPRDVNKLGRVIEEWLTSETSREMEFPCWQVLVDVVAHGAGGDDPGLAMNIAKKSKTVKLPSFIKNIPDDYIDSRHLRFVVRALHDVAMHWNSIGHQLKIANLDKIKHDYVTVSRCLIVMADSLLKGKFIELPGELATWKTIVKVIKAPSGGNYPLHAKRVATNLRDFQTFCPGPIAKDVDATSLYDIDLEQKQIVQKISENLVQGAARWFEIGALLGLPLNTLTTIKDEPHPNTNARMRRVVEEWLLQAEMLDLEPPSWQVLVDVVAHGAGGDDPGLAMDLAEKSKTINLSSDMKSSRSPAMMSSSPPMVSKSLQLNEVALITMKSEDLDELVPLLDPIAPHWDSFMGELGVADRQREKIRENNASLRSDGQCRHCLIAGLKVLPKPVTYGYIASVLEGKIFANEPLASKIRELHQDNEVLKANEAEDFVDKHLLPIVQNWEVFLNRLDLPRAQIRKLPGSDMFAKKCLEEGLADWLAQDKQPTLEKLKRALECGLITANPAVVEKVEALFKKRLTEQPSGNILGNQSPWQIFRQPTPAEEEGYDPSGDKSQRISDDMGWPWRGKKIHYQPYKRGASKTKAITLQEQNGELTTINPNTNYQRPPVGNFYRMDRFPHGIALIISNKIFAQHNTREGTEEDVKNLRKTFRYLGYEVIIQRDCTSTEIEAFFKPEGLVFQKAKEKHDSFVCCMLSHGGINTIIGTDSKEVNIGQLGGVQYNLSKCDALKNKPKLFFFQKGRTHALESDFPQKIHSDSDKLPSKADYYIHFATVLGQKSTRHMDYGSRYVLELCRTLVSESHNSTLSSMHRTVSTRVRAYKTGTIQKPVAEDLLGSSVYFFEDVLEAGSDQSDLPEQSSGLIPANPAPVEIGEAFDRNRLQEQPSGSSIGSEGQCDMFRKPTPAEEEGFLGGVDVIARTECTYTGAAESFDWKGHGFRLHFPENVLPQDVSACVVDIKGAISGQFEFPEDTELVSGVYCIYSPHKFTQPVTVEVQHCVSINSPRGASRLSFVRAKCSQPDLPYQFQLLDGGVFTGHSSYGSVKLTHFSIVGVICKGVQALSRWFYGPTANRYNAHLFYGSSTPSSSEAHLADIQKVHFVITKDLELHITVVADKYSGTTPGPSQEVEFAGSEIKLSIPPEGVAVGNGGSITPLAHPRIQRIQVDSFLPGRRIPSCELLVKKHKGSEVEVFRVELEGAKEPCNYFSLECPPVSGAVAASASAPQPAAVCKQPSEIDINNAILTVNDWFELGQQLGLVYNVLEEVHISSERFGVKRQRAKMVHVWLRSDPEASWSKLCGALERIGENTVAQGIRERFRDPVL